MSDDWNEWYGGECPLDDGDLVEVKIRDGSGMSGFEAGSYDWRHLEPQSRWDIVAYRVVTP